MKKTIEIITSDITQSDWKKIKKDLFFMDLAKKLAIDKEYRLIVSGGYSADGSFGRITRSHGDVDIQIFGKGKFVGQFLNELIDKARRELSLPDLELVDEGRKEFYHSYVARGSGFRADIYYIQVTSDPYGVDKYVIKKDGTHSDRQKYDTVQAELEGVVFEATSPESELKDILYKREVRGDKPKLEHDQDIVNLRRVVASE